MTHSRVAAFAAVISFSVLTACSELSMVGAASVITTDKTLTDNVVSYLSGKDCSMVRKEAGRTYCTEDEVNPTPTVHCYRSLGDVTCYDRRDPYGDQRRELGAEGYALSNL